MRLHKLTALNGATVHAVDGDIGKISDFYFDDERWTVRYAIVDTGSWLARNHVVISVMSLLPPDWTDRQIPVKLTRDQVQQSPDLGSHPEVSRALEQEVLTYYGYPFYWAGDALWGPVSNPSLAAEQAGILPQPDLERDAAETHLHRCRDVMGYHIDARDGGIGHVDDFFVDPTTWAIRYLEVDTSNWIGGKAVAIEPSSIGRIDWAARTVRVNLSRHTIEESPDARELVESI